MDKKEKEVQKALGLFKMYEGYVKVMGTTYYEVYEVEDITLEDAEQQIREITAQKKSLKLKFTQEKNINPKNKIVVNKINDYYVSRRHKCKQQH